jgi:outer membrane receptor protein involved in Fe transport
MALSLKVQWVIELDTCLCDDSQKRISTSIEEHTVMCIKSVPIQKFRYILLLVILCSINVLSAKQQELQSGKESEVSRIKARIDTLTKELTAIETQPTESVPAAKEQAPNFFEMSLQELMEVKIETSATLTKTSPRLVPFALTTITQEDIRRSQARSLYELLEMYVPNLEMLFAREYPKALGLRGIISHQSNKFLLLVNGRIMNERTTFGVMTEVDLPMLTDIHHIDVVRGPSSALYGPGALSMTINIVTDNANTYQGQETTIRGGDIEKFATFEYKLGKKLDEDSGVFLYAGVSHYRGATAADSPTVFGTKAEVWLLNHYPTWTWDIVPGDEYWGKWFKNLNQAPFDRPKMKMYAEYTKGNFDIWARYIQGGQWIDFTCWHDDFARWDWWHVRVFADESVSYNQATIQASYDQEVSSDLSVKYVASYERFANENENFEQAYFQTSYAEDEIYGKILANWKPRENHSLAFGGEWAHDEFGIPVSGKAISDHPFEFHYPPNRVGTDPYYWVGYMPRWNTEHPALLGEYQWNINDKFTLFLSGRVDWHPYTDTMYSPRGVLVYTPNTKDTFKLMLSRSARTNTAAQMWIDYHYLETKSPVETINAYELRYERQHSKNFWFGGSVFLYELPDALGDIWEVSEGVSTGTKVVGDIRSWGFELEAGYHKDRLKVDLSHGYTKLLKMTVKPGIPWQDYSAAPYGFGNDLAQWNNHISKIRAEYEVNKKLIVNGALCVLWGNPGGKDAAEYRNYLFPNWDYDLGFDKPFAPSAYLNLGAEYKWSKNTTLNVIGYNLLGLVDIDLNKRRIGFDRELPGRFRIQPVAFGASFTHKF